MPVQILPLDLKDHSRVRKFVELPFRLYRDVPQWVPPLGDDERPKLSQKHPFSWLARQTVKPSAAWLSSKTCATTTTTRNR